MPHTDFKHGFNGLRYISLVLEANNCEVRPVCILGIINLVLEANICKVRQEDSVVRPDCGLRSVIPGKITLSLIHI